MIPRFGDNDYSPWAGSKFGFVCLLLVVMNAPPQGVRRSTGRGAFFALNLREERQSATTGCQAANSNFEVDSLNGKKPPTRGGQPVGSHVLFCLSV